MVTKSRGLRTIVRWQEHEDETLVELALHHTASELAEKLGRSCDSVQSRLHLLRREGRIGHKVRVSPKNPWNATQLAALIDLSRRLYTDEQIARRLGRTRSSVSACLAKLRREGAVPKGGRIRNDKSLQPFHVPTSLKHLLLARTCITCGQFRAAHYFYRQGASGNRRNACSSCVRRRRYEESQRTRPPLYCVICKAHVPEAKTKKRKYCAACYLEKARADARQQWVQIKASRDPRCIICGDSKKNDLRTRYCSSCRKEVTREQHARTTANHLSDPDGRRYRHEQGRRYSDAHPRAKEFFCQVCNAYLPSDERPRRRKYCAACGPEVIRDRAREYARSKLKDRFCVTCKSQIPIYPGRYSLYCQPCREKEKEITSCH